MWSQAVVVHPWVGARYLNPQRLKFRTLILGESNYTSADKFSPDLVKNCVADDLATDSADRDTSGFCRFATKLRRIIFGEADALGPQGFWPEVAFYNYVQLRVGDEARIRPTEEMWRSGEAAFQEIVSELRPERILVLGKATWFNLLRFVRHEPIDPYSARLQVGTERVLAGYVYHPSSSLRYQEWRLVTQRLLD